MTTVQNIWKRLREAVDKALKFDPRPPTVVDGGLENEYRVIVHDGLPPEANAMALAMFSRSPRSWLEHYKVVLAKGAQRFMSMFYVKYGHKSIGDCGSITIAIEGVSMLCAKAIQQFLLYKGQEASTRYLDMKNQPLVNPMGTTKGDMILSRAMNLYESVLELLIGVFRNERPLADGENQTEYEKAVKARAFDVARGFLPAGVATYVGWHTTLREAVDHLLELRHHPLEEVRVIAEMMSSALHERYPSSGFDKRYLETEKYVEACMREYTYIEPSIYDAGGLTSTHNFDRKKISSQFRLALQTRPPKTELPKVMKALGTITSSFLIDFGSFRDLQRHRSGTILMPPLTTQLGFHQWYADQIPAEQWISVSNKLGDLADEINLLQCSREVKQYYIPMGFRVACECTFDLPAAVYVAELRSKQDVHPTLRVIAQDLGRAIHRIFPEMNLYCDMSQWQWSISRGKQDIVKKQE